MNLNDEREEVSEIARALAFAVKTQEDETSKLAEAVTKLHHVQQAQEILQLVSRAVQQRAHEKISEVVSRCLTAVFDEPYSFKINFEMKRGKTEAQLRFTRDGLDVDPMSASGGGVVDVAAFALRVACLVLHRPRLAQVVVLDEPFRFLSAQYRDNVRSMLEELSREMRIQIIMVTHIEEIATGKIIDL
jgi:DNA repair exonuclease SbcCD ATPase subunit